MCVEFVEGYFGEHRHMDAHRCEFPCPHGIKAVARDPVLNTAGDELLLLTNRVLLLPFLLLRRNGIVAAAAENKNIVFF